MSDVRQLKVIMSDIFNGKSIRQTSLPEQVCEALRTAILESRIKPGEKLPSEEKIAARFNVSRTSVREALSMLKSEGLLETRRGAMGGNFVSRADTTRILEVVVDSYRTGGLTIEEVIEYRQSIEPVVLDLACRNRTDEDLEIMLANLKLTRDALEKEAPERAEQINFHRLMANATHNRLISSSMDAVIEITWELQSQRPIPLLNSWGDFYFNVLFFNNIYKSSTEGARELMAEHFYYLAELHINRTVTMESRIEHYKRVIEELELPL